MEQLLQQSQPQSVEHPPKSGIFTLYIKATFLLNQLKLPNIQRELDPTHIDNLSIKFSEEYKQNGYFNFGMFDLCYYNNTLYLLNGQHRYAVLGRLEERHLNTSIQVKIKKTDTEQEMNNYFQIVNDSKQSIIYKNSNHQVILNSLRRHLTTKYVQYMVKSKNPHKPHINLDRLMEKIDEIKLIQTLEIRDEHTIINLIEEINNFYRTIQYETDKWKSWKIPDIVNLLEKTKQKSQISPLYLGIYPQFEWLDRIIKHKKENIMYSDMPHYWKTYKTRKISNTKRNKVWRKRNTKIDGECFVCQQSLNIENFQCGHIIAAFWGGDTKLDNLEPICGSCNRDMGVENLIIYKNREGLYSNT